METLSVGRSQRAAEVGPDPSWRDLYRVGGIAALLSFLLYVVATVLTFLVPAAPI